MRPLSEQAHPGQRYPFYRILSELQDLPKEDVALAYSAIVLSIPKRHLLSYNGDSEAVDFFKKQFQEETRSNLFILARQVNIGKTPFSSLRSAYETKIEDTLEALREGSLPPDHKTSGKIPLKFQGGTIEKVIADLFQSETINLPGIYDALKEGAEAFRSYVTHHGRDHRSLEYNYLFRALKEI